MKALKELLAIAQDASKQRDTDIIAQFKADHADELSQEKEKMWCLLINSTSSPHSESPLLYF